MYNSREKMTTKTATKLIYKGNTFCRKLLKNLEKKFAKMAWNFCKWSYTVLYFEFLNEYTAEKQLKELRKIHKKFR